MLSRVLDHGNTIAVIGSGCSKSLGYPDWTKMTLDLVRRAKSWIESEAGRHKYAHQLERFNNFESSLNSPADLSSKDYYFFLGECQKVFKDSQEDKNLYYDYFKKNFDKKEIDRGANNPFNYILDMPINRFITTNYDCEIERSLHEKKGIPLARFGLETNSLENDRALSFSQADNEFGPLSKFVPALKSGEPLVFHCHGRFDQPKSVIASEADYQRWYVGDREGFGIHFRQAIELIFFSNPLLFLGYGLEEEDLLKPLRFLGAVEAERKSARSLFAVLPNPKNWVRHGSIYERYGVNVIPYEVGSDHNQSFCQILKSIKSDLNKWRDETWQKPYFRKVLVKEPPPSPYRHYIFDLGNHGPLAKENNGDLAEEQVKAQIEDLVQMIKSQEKVICIMGPGGTGKTWHAVRLMEKVEKEIGRYKGYFFWSSYYANDYLTGLDRALAYMDPQAKQEGNRQKRLKQCLEKMSFFLVFDGFERLLRETDHPEVGEPIGKGCESFLEAISLSKASKSTVIITSRLLPKLNQTHSITKYKLNSLEAKHVAKSQIFQPFSQEAPALCSLLDGHAYGLLLAAIYLKRNRVDKTNTLAASLKRSLSRASPGRRVNRIIEIIIEDINDRWDGLASAFLERTAVFMSPVTKEILRICLNLSRPNKKPEERILEQLIQDLLEAKILFKIKKSLGEEVTSYTVHPTVRSYLFHKGHQVTSDIMPNFTLPGFTSGTAAVHPVSSESSKMVKVLFSRIMEKAEHHFQKGETKIALELCRSAFSVLRSRMEGLTTPRWTSYQDYILLIVKLINLVKNISNRVWDYQDQYGIQEIEDVNAILFADEISWLYNDFGLTLCAEGNMLDCFGAWEQGYEINRIIEGRERAGQYIVQSQLHLAHTFLELGLLQDADLYLRETIRSNIDLDDEDYEGRIIGYLGLMAHLRGDLQQAAKYYKKGLKIIAGSNPRAESIFYRHRADVFIEIGSFDKAKRCYSKSLSIAESGNHPDLLAYAALTRGHLFRKLEKYKKARSQYETALENSRRIGIRRLEADVLAQLARLALDLNDPETARQKAGAALSIANQLGLGLRQTHILVILGKATIRGGQHGLGESYLKQAHKMARDQQYYLRGREVEEYFQNIGKKLTPADWLQHVQKDKS